jgi:hypothetical protein
MLNALLLVAVVSAEPTPTASPLKTIVRVHSSPICTTIRQNVGYAMEGLQTNDGLVNASKPVLLRMGTEFQQPFEVEAQLTDTDPRHLNGTSSVPGGVHDTNPALLLDNQRLKALAAKLARNLAIIETTLADPTKFPAQAKTDDEQEAQLLKAQLEAIADEQRRSLGVLAGLTDTFSMQDLIAKGDGTQGVINFPGGAPSNDDPNPPGKTASHDDQDVSFKDPISGSAQQNAGTPKDPTVNKDPAVSQRGTDLSNNPMARFYLGVTKIQANTGAAEDALTKTLTDLAASCEP